MLRSFIIFGVGIPACGVNLCPFVGWDYGRFQLIHSNRRLHLGGIRFRTCPLSGCVGFGDGDLSYVSQTGRSTTDIQSNGWTKYRRVRQKRKQINMIGRVLSCASNCATLCIITFRGILLAIAYRSSYLCCNCESTTAVSYNFSRSLLMDISIESRSATRGMLA